MRWITKLAQRNTVFMAELPLPALAMSENLIFSMTCFSEEHFLRRQDS